MVTKYFLPSFLIGLVILTVPDKIGTGGFVSAEDGAGYFSKFYQEKTLFSFYDDDETPSSRLSWEEFSCNLLAGAMRLRQSETEIIDLTNNFKGVEEEFDDEIWGGGIKLDNIFLWPESERQTARWFTAGLNIYAFKADYSIPLANGVISQTHQIDSAALIIMLVLKMAPPQSRFRPYLSVGLGPAWTIAKDERISEDGVNPPSLDHSRDLQASVAFEMAVGVETYLGKHFYLTLEAKGLKLANQYDLFYDRASKRFTTEMATEYQGVVSSFGLGVRF